VYVRGPAQADRRDLDLLRGRLDRLVGLAQLGRRLFVELQLETLGMALVLPQRLLAATGRRLDAHQPQNRLPAHRRQLDQTLQGLHRPLLLVGAHGARGRLQNGALEPPLEPRALDCHPLPERLRADRGAVEQRAAIEPQHVLYAAETGVA